MLITRRDKEANLLTLNSSIFINLKMSKSRFKDLLQPTQGVRDKTSQPSSLHSILLIQMAVDAIQQGLALKLQYNWLHLAQVEYHSKNRRQTSSNHKKCLLVMELKR